jgi:hypothetical protein
LTIYNDEHYFVDNPLNRYAIGYSDDLRFNPGGSLDILIQLDSPGADAQANWLPGPAEGTHLNPRMYWPKREALGGTWQPLAVRRGN